MLRIYDLSLRYLGTKTLSRYCLCPSFSCDLDGRTSSVCTIDKYIINMLMIIIIFIVLIILANSFNFC